MADLRTAAQQALEALEVIDKEFRRHGRQHWPEAVKARVASPALRAALAEHFCDTHCTWADHAAGCVRAEPVAWAVYDIKHGGSKALHWPEQHSPNGDPSQFKAVPLYTAPPQRKPLDEDQMNEAYIYIWRNLPSDFGHTASEWVDVGVRYAERVHGITNPVVEEDKAPHPEDYEITVLRQQIATYQTALDDAIRRKHGS